MGGAPIKPTERRNAATKRMRVRLNAMEKGQQAGPRIGNSSNQKSAFLTNNAGERVQEECRRCIAHHVLTVANTKLGTGIMKYSAFAGIAMAILLAIPPAAASSLEEGVLLSQADYIYLTAQGVQANNPVLQKLSPKELNHLHLIINDERTQSNPKSRTDAVRATLAEFEGHQLWEKTNPGHLWDDEKRQAPKKAIPN
jgi:hypothetical protein